MVLLLSFCTGLIAAAAGALAAGAVAAGCVAWYQISPREGGSGYFVVFIGLAGLIAGFVIGCICGGVVQADSFGGYVKAVGLSLGVIVLIAGTAALLCRLLAHIPPVIDGDPLFLVVEARLPADYAGPPASEPGKASLFLGSIPHGSRTVRKSKYGPLWVEDAAQVDGRWVVRGAVEIFTRRGVMMMMPAIGDRFHEGFTLPLPANPGRQYQQWSEWLPRPRAEVKPSNTITYRFRVQRWSEPMKTETLGDFQIDTITNGFFDEAVGEKYHIASRDNFRVRFKNTPVLFSDPVATMRMGEEDAPVIEMVATFSSPTPAVVAQVQKADGGRAFYLLSDVAGGVRCELIAGGYSICNFEKPSLDGPVPVEGRYVCPNRRQLAGGIYRIGFDGVLETATLKIHRFTQPEKIYQSDGVQPLGLSPDRRSFVRAAPLHESPTGPPTTLLAVTDFVGDRTYLLRIDRPRMHYSRESDIDAAWVAHHYEWSPGTDGIDQLTPRADFVPLPYQGQFASSYGGTWCYRLDSVGEPMRGMLEAFLIEKFQAVRQPSPAEYEHKFTLNGQGLGIACSDEHHYVLLTFEPKFDPAAAESIAAAFNAELAGGQYDALFKMAQASD